jgi:hypothetical protein
VRIGRKTRENEFANASLASSLLAFGKSGDVGARRAAQPSQPFQSRPSATENREPDELEQELDVDATFQSGLAIAMFMRITVAYKTDLLVIGLHHCQSHISRLWSTVYELGQNAPRSVLGVH